MADCPQGAINGIPQGESEMSEPLEPLAAEGKLCRKCGHPDLMRIPRNWQDRLRGTLHSQPLRRYRCGRCRAEQTVSSDNRSA